MLTLAVDAMGGDLSTNATLPACANFLQNYLDAKIILVGNEQQITKDIKLLKLNFDSNRTSFIYTDQTIVMSDTIETAMRKKRQSSMRLAIEAVKNNNADVCVSSGNTGALMALSHYLLKTISGIDRPAIATFIPNQKNSGTVVLDLGANSDCQAHHLLQFAHMATVMLKAIKNIGNPTVGLLNIGEEIIKGNEVVKKASILLQESELNFFGNVEGNDIFKGTTDIVVCDGFIGNIALKSAEGAAKMISNIIKESFTKNLVTKVLAFICRAVLQEIKQKVDHRKYNGAILLGLNGLVIKSHGSADSFAFFHALSYAYQASKQNMVNSMHNAFKNI